MIHIILFSVVLLAVLGRRNKLCLYFSFLLLTIVSSIRYMYGNDYRSYYIHFYNIKNGYESVFDSEILFTLLNKLLPSFHVLIIVTSVVFIYQIYKFMMDNLNQRQIWIGVFIFLINPYLYLVNLSAIRQCIAMCCFCVAVSYMLKRDVKRYLLFIIAAALFHKSAILLLPVYLLIGTKRIKKRYVVLIILGIWFLLSFPEFYSVIETILSLFDDLNYVRYMDEGLSNSLRATLLSSIYLVYVLFNLPKLEGKYVLYGKLYLISMILAVLAYRLSMVTRIQMYFDIFSIVVLPHLFYKNINNGYITIYFNNPLKTIWGVINQYILPALIIMIYFLRYYSFFTNPMWQSFVKYRTILDLL